MITAIDSSILIDVFGADPTWGSASAQILRRCIAEGATIACEIVWSETAVAFEREEDFVGAMETLGVAFSAITRPTAIRASRVWREFLARGGGRRRMAADFLIGAHAVEQADRLLARDRGFYRDYFKSLRVVDPSRA